MLVDAAPGTRGFAVVKGSRADGCDYVLIDDTKLKLSDMKLALEKVRAISAIAVAESPTFYVPVSGEAAPPSSGELKVFRKALDLLRSAPKSKGAYGLHRTLVVGLGNSAATP